MTTTWSLERVEREPSKLRIVFRVMAFHSRNGSESHEVFIERYKTRADKLSLDLDNTIPW